MPKVKWANIKNGRGKITGRIELFWSIRLRDWVSVPGVSKYENYEAQKLRGLVNKLAK
jgi:hypothetical protein